MTTEECVDRAVRAIDRTATIELAQSLVRIPSITGDEEAAQSFIAQVMRQAGLEVQVLRFDLASLARDPGFPGIEVQRSQAVVVTGSLGSAGGPTLLLNGHIDVVPPGEAEWDESPWSGTIRHGRMFGRGTCDMKAGLAAAVSAASALRRSASPLRGRLTVQSVSGEEDGGVGTFGLIRTGIRADAAIILEPTSLRLVPSQAGALTFRIRIKGHAAHAALRYEGVSALDKFAPVQQRLNQLESELNAERDELFLHLPIAYPLCIGRLTTGTWPSTVPGELVCEGRVGVPMSLEARHVRRAFELAIGDAAAHDAWLAEHPPAVEWWGNQCEPAVSSLSTPAFRVLSQAHMDEFGVAPVVHGVPYGSDLRLFVREAGIPAVLYGPGDVRHAHQVNEAISIEELLSATRVITATAARYLCAVPP